MMIPSGFDNNRKIFTEKKVFMIGEFFRGGVSEKNYGEKLKQASRESVN